MNKKLSALIKTLALAVGMVGLFVLLFERPGKDSNIADNGVVNQGTAYDFAMGTSMSVQIYDDNEEQIRQEIFSTIKKLDTQVISWREDASELGKLNSGYIVNMPWDVSEILYTALAQSCEICKDSNGALDITIRPLANVWGIESSNDFIPPTEKAIDEALELVGYENIQLGQIDDNLQGEVTVTQEDIIIDLGAVGKGYALDVVKGILTDNEVKGALVTVGGSIMVYGNKADNSNWRVGIRDPKESISSEKMMGYLEFMPGTVTCISTSGGYEKFKEYEGIKYHHILDRSTGYPAESELLSVTIVCDNGLVSDGLSTACFVLGYEKSLEILDKYNAEAVFVMTDGDIIITDGLVDNWKEK